ncbi:hypothetical protein E2C01_091667 [Portunus trituberculatus]|uniref:Uncharacterized protein n=1 Tax=Portunus trituberculatus TaxID=210409 RepID=A0A5B7JNJ5_PORTR|nr:hypothetical protein [Portunus trituberculatus]
MSSGKEGQGRKAEDPRPLAKKAGRKDLAGTSEGEQDCKRRTGEERLETTSKAVGCACRVQMEGSSSKVKKVDQDRKDQGNRRKEKDCICKEQNNNARLRTGTWMRVGHPLLKEDAGRQKACA